MKDQLQKEIKEKVKPGVKPSQLRKSRSLSSIPKAPPLPKSTPLTKSKSAEELQPNSSKIEQLETKIATLELKLEISQRDLVEKDAEKQLFQDQLKEKQSQIENLRERLETSSTQELDQSLIKRHQNLKD